MNRRKFIHTISICTVSTALFGAPKKKSEKLKLTNVEIKVGLKKPMKFLHVTDSHLVTWDERSPKQEDIYKKRIKVFSHSRKRWEMTLAYAKENNFVQLTNFDITEDNIGFWYEIGFDIFFWGVNASTGKRGTTAMIRVK